MFYFGSFIMDMIIYGAQGYALGAYKAIKVLYPERRVLFFAVTEMGNNPSHLAGLKVKEIGSVSEYFSTEEKKNIEILIATPENVQGDIEKTLDEQGFSNHTGLTSRLWDEFMTKMNLLTGYFRPLVDGEDGTGGVTTGIVSSVRIYMAKSHKDKPLSKPFDLPGFMTPIQVGAANTDDAIVEVRDNTGENISSKNGNYCELTGLYWVWKNLLKKRPASEGRRDDRVGEYYGFAQYRRILMLSDEHLSKLVEKDIDVVLPYPLYYEPDINAHHERYLKDSDWEALLTALRELQPEYADAVPQILAGDCMYNYNVILAKKDVLRDYCEWLFPILERTEELSDPKGCDRADRYIGYMGETLETLYFMKNSEKLKIAHTGCRLLV